MTRVRAGKKTEGIMKHKDILRNYSFIQHQHCHGEVLYLALELVDWLLEGKRGIPTEHSSFIAFGNWSASRILGGRLHVRAKPVIPPPKCFPGSCPWMFF